MRAGKSGHRTSCSRIQGGIGRPRSGASWLPCTSWQVLAAGALCTILFTLGAHLVLTSDAEETSFLRLSAIGQLPVLGSSVISICHPDWHGIRAAAHSRGPPVLQIRDLASSATVRTVINSFKRMPLLELVVIEGILPGSVLFSSILQRELPTVSLAIVYHGAPSNNAHEEESSKLEEVLQAVDTGAVAGIGFVKFGLADSFRQLGLPAFTLWNSPTLAPTLPAAKYEMRSGKWHIGVLGTRSTFEKNLISQLLAVCSMENTVVHVIKLPAVLYLQRCTVEFVEHGFLTHSDFVALLGNMHLNLYVSLTECFPMVVLESLSANVPCLVSSTTALYAVDTELQAQLVVQEFDNPTAILTQVYAALADLESLSFRCKGLTQWLYIKAEREWQAFTHAVTARPVNSTATHSAELPYSPWMYKDALPITGKAYEGKLTVAILTYELAPVTPGGAGVVVGAVIQELLSRGHSVIVIAYLGRAAINEWCDKERNSINMNYSIDANYGSTASLTCFDVLAVLQDNGVHVVEQHANVYVSRARQVAAAVNVVYNMNAFDMLEIFDYAGGGYELLQRRYSSSMTSEALYLPAHIPIVARLHGTLEFIAEVEGRASTREEQTMHRMERFCLETADVLLAQTTGMRTFYSQIYGLNPGRMILATPPMKRILAPVIAAADTDIPLGVQQASVDLVAGVAASCQRENNCFTIIVPGKLQIFKGTHTVADAMSHLPSKLQATGATLHFVFFGLVTDCPQHGRKMSKCLLDAATDNIRVTILDPLPRTAYKWLLGVIQPVAAVMASKFETFSLALHEMIALDLHVIVSDIPAFRDLPASHALLFHVGNASALSDAITAVVTDQTVHVASDMTYDDPILPYGLVATYAHQKREQGATLIPMLAGAVRKDIEMGA
jgi:glycosyltransferase involved in cell wall biosynthesis